MDEVSLGDTIGVATPNQVAEVLGLLLRRRPAPTGWRCTCTTRAARRWRTCWPALEMGITIFDAAAGGLGGCPYAPGASGNLATEDLLYMLHGMGIATGVDLAQVVAASAYLAESARAAPASKFFTAAQSASAE